ncbi:MAG: porin family protein [Pseudomarimonas sp.]
MRKHTLLGTTLSALLLCATAAHAQDTSFYLHGSLGQGTIETEQFVAYDDDKDTTLAVAFGWRLRPWLAVEFGYNDFGNYQSRCPAAVCPPLLVFRDLDYTSFELGLNFRVPFGDSGVFGQARAGVHNWDVGFGGSNTDPRYGLGVGYVINDRFDVSLDFDQYQTDNAIRDLDRVSVGVDFKF